MAEHSTAQRSAAHHAVGVAHVLQRRLAQLGAVLGQHFGLQGREQPGQLGLKLPSG